MNRANPDSSGKLNEISIADLFKKVGSLVNYLKSKWLLISAFLILGIIAGVCYSIFKRPTYTATCTFVLEDPGHNSAGQYGGLASLVGINLSSGAGGIFEGDNILELYKSRTMIEKTLLSPCSFDGKNQLLIDRFIDKNNLRPKDNDDKIHYINFNGDPKNFNRKQDSIITILVNLINKKVLNVYKPDKKLSIINVEVISNDELFSKCFTDKIVHTVNDFYVQTKTKKASQNVQTLQHQADSVRIKLNASLYGVASAIDADPNANPQMSTLRVSSQKKQVDVQASSAIYSEIVKNLELAKISLREEVPLIQVIDNPVLPLKKNKVGLIKGSVIGGLSFGFIIAFYLMVRKIFSYLII